MAVELRCPKCKAKLSLRVEPEPDSEIECPKCANVFPCEENIVHAGDADEEPKPKKKKAAAAESDEKPKKDEKKDAPEEKKDEAKPAGEQKKKRKRRKAKKRKTSNKVMIAIITGVVLVVGSVAGVLIWFFTKKSASQEMMTYLPDDSSIVVGLNLGHMKKYPDFYKSASNAFVNTTFKKTGDMFAKALGNESIDEVIDYVVQGAGAAGNGSRFDATVMRTKEEYDTGLLSKIPGAKEYTLSGVKYYTLPEGAEVGYPGMRVFAPTNRLVVFCSGDTIPEAKFKAMLTGNKDNLDATPYARSGPLGKQVIRGTVWQFNFGPAAPTISGFIRQAPVAVTPGGNDDEAALWAEIRSVQTGAKCSGYKASVGSRETRGEWFVWYDSPESATSMRKKWRERDFIKDEEKDVPRWFKSMAQRSGIGKTAENVIRDGLDFKASGELFSIRTSADTKLLQSGISSLINTFVGQAQSGMPGGGGPVGMPGGGGKPGGGPGPIGLPPPGGGPAGVPPGRPRRSGFPGRRRRSARTIPLR